MKRGHWAAILCLFTIFPGVLAATATADKAGIPMDTNVEFDESAQNAIVAWNGETECLILSTDLRSTQPGRLMEMLPLPSAPYDIKAGNTSSFTNLIRLYNEKMERLDVSPGSANGEKAGGLGGDAVEEFEGIEVIFSSSVGLHNITVVKIESTDHFLQWAKSFSAAQGVPNISIDARLNTTVGAYLGNNIRYFVFDIVDVTAEIRTADPVVYLFNTSYLYYPLRTTYDALPESRTAPNDISVFIVADGVVSKEESYINGVHYTGGIDQYLEFTKSELGLVSGPLGALFNRSAFVAHLSGRMYVSGRHYAIQDIRLYSTDFRRPSDSELRAQYERADFLRAIKPFSPSLAYSMLRSIYEPGYAPPAAYLALILLGIFIAPFVLGLFFRSVMERGSRKGSFWVLLGGSMVVGGVGDKLDRRLKGMRGLLPNLIIGAGVLVLVLSIVLFAMR